MADPAAAAATRGQQRAEDSFMGPDAAATDASPGCYLLPVPVHSI